MQIRNDVSYSNTPNFKEIKKVSVRGLWRKYPDMANQVLESFNKNDLAQKFCDKYDVKIVLTTEDTARIRGYFNIIYNRKNSGFLQKIKQFFNNIEVSTVVTESEPENIAMSEVTEELKKRVSSDAIYGEDLKKAIEDADKKMQVTEEEKKAAAKKHQQDWDKLNKTIEKMTKQNK